MSDTPGSGNRDYSTISPSARALLQMKAYTDIPFAKQAAELINDPEKYESEQIDKELGFWARVVHFESRYRTIDQLLQDINISNILELSSGFSFRGLDMVSKRNVFYIDTDLPDIITQKRILVETLQDKDVRQKGKLEILPLNVLDEQRFTEITDRFPPGEIVIVNEGLLVYLDTAEKEKLCAIVRNILKQRGGYWITGDIYIKNKSAGNTLRFNDKLQQFLEEHRIEENKFDSFESAESFFKSNGFIIDRKAEPEPVASVRQLKEYSTPEQWEMLGKSGKIRETWRLRVVEE
jgi:O-methyltransferase involved in polyketide biosynthesis